MDVILPLRKEVPRSEHRGRPADHDRETQPSSRSLNGDSQPIMPSMDGQHNSSEKRRVETVKGAVRSPENDTTSAQSGASSSMSNGVASSSSRKKIHNGNGGFNSDGIGAGDRTPRRESREDRKGGHFSLASENALGFVLEHTQESSTAHPGSEPRTTHRTSLVDVVEGAEAAATLRRLARETSPIRNQDKDKERERVLKLSPTKIQELTSSPQSIPCRVIPTDWDQGGPGRRVISDGVLTSTGTQIESDGSGLPIGEARYPDENTRRSSKEIPSLEGPAPLKSPSTTSRSRPQVNRAVSTPQSARRATMAGNSSERLAQTWASRTKVERPSVNREIDSKHHDPLPIPPAEPPLPSPLPQNIPLPPLSIPTYLQLELASGRPSPLYIHRAAMSDFPYESSRVKLERLMNFLKLPHSLEQVLWFGILACLDAWLYSFTILPLRFIKAVYILLESWMVNLGVEARFLVGFIAKGIGRVWRRRNRAPSVSSSVSETPPGERDFRTPVKPPEQRRRHRADTHHRGPHRRQKSIPSALLPDDKADILKGLLMIATCSILMYFDASRMYHWIRGQAAIKLYVIYNVLEVGDRLFAAIGQDVLECLFSREALERRPDGRSKVFRPFGLFLLALAYTVIHSTALFYQVMTLNVAVNSYSNALITLLLSNQFVEIKSTVFKKFEKENLFQLTCADVVERFQLWLMLTIIASRNIVETGAFQFGSSLISASLSGSQGSTRTNSTPLSTPPRSSTSILPQAFTLVPSSLISSFSNVHSFLPALAQVLGPFLVVLGSEMLVDWLKHAYINKFNNYRPAIYGRFLDILAKDYYTNAFGDPNLTRRLGLPVIPLSCLFFRVSIQTYHMLLAALLPQSPPSTSSSFASSIAETTSLSTIHNHYAASGAPLPSSQPFTFATLPAHAETFVRQVLANAIPSPAQSVYIFTIVLILTGFVLLLILKLLLGILLLTIARSRYKAMKQREAESSNPAPSSNIGAPTSTSASASSSTALSSGVSVENSNNAPRARGFVVEGSRRAGGWGMIEVNEDHRRWIYGDDPEGLKKLKDKEKEREKSSRSEELRLDHVQRYEMAAKRIW